MPSGNSLFVINKPLFDVLLAKFYSQNADAFSGSEAKPVVNIEFVFRATAAPTVNLSPRSDGRNIAITFAQMVLETYDYTNGQRGALTDSEPVRVDVAASLSVNGSQLALTNLLASGPNTLDERAAQMFRDKVLPQYQTALAHVDLPDFQKLMSIQIAVNDVYVQQALVFATASIEGGGNLPSLSGIETSVPAITAAIGQDAVNNYIRNRFGEADTSDHGKKSSAGFGYRWSANAHAGNPHMSISDGKAHGTLDVGAGASGGIEAFGGWIDKGLSVSITTPPIGLRVEKSSPTQAVAKFYLDGQLKIDFGLPGALEKFADDILSGAESIVSPLISIINARLEGATMNLFSLPDSIPGTPFKASLSFQALGLGVDSIQSVIRVQ